MIVGRAGVAAIAAIGLAARLAADGRQAAPSLPSVIGQLGSLDFKTRIAAAQTIRRLPVTTAIPALVDAARGNPDGYVRYQTLVLLSGFGPDAANQTMRQVLTDKNDRLRTVAYAWFEHHPQPDVTPALVAALTTEVSEFVRPALTRAIAATQDEARVTATLVPLVQRGVNFFRSGVMEALGDYRAKSAVPALVEAAQQDGPLQENAIEALGKIGDASVIPLLGSLEPSVSPDVRPSVAAALCELGADCEAKTRFIIGTLAAASRDESRARVAEAAAHALAVLAVAGKQPALTALLDEGEAAAEPARSPIALATGYVALRQPGVMLQAIQARAARPATLALLRDAFDILSDEDFERECFFADVRRLYWEAPEGSAQRQTAQAVIAALEF
jgi:HEAT repeat protein